MKTSLIALALLWLGVVWAGDGRYRLSVDGLACPFCAYGIEKQLRRIEGVQTVDVDLKQGQVIVTTAEGHVLTEAQARRAAEDAGFTLRRFDAGNGP